MFLPPNKKSPGIEKHYKHALCPMCMCSLLSGCLCKHAVLWWVLAQVYTLRTVHVLVYILLATGLHRCVCVCVYAHNCWPSKNNTFSAKLSSLCSNHFRRFHVSPCEDSRIPHPTSPFSLTHSAFLLTFLSHSPCIPSHTRPDLATARCDTVYIHSGSSKKAQTLFTLHKGGKKVHDQLLEIVCVVGGGGFWKRSSHSLLARLPKCTFICLLEFLVVEKSCIIIISMGILYTTCFLVKI